MAQYSGIMISFNLKFEITENVGRDFAKVARQIHDGEAPNRSIIGEATAQETIDLIEDEIPITPLPWLNRKTN